MSFSKVANCLLIAFIALANGMPQDEINMATTKSSGPLPFLQFTNGGIRVNFAGYHAEAGLGGLLQGTGGGLHASAGTPWGANAAAGLGGQLNGQDGNLGGGLYARAGLGRGRPEAAAGLGGRIDGRSLNPISGGLYAGATPGGPGVGVQLGGGLEGVAVGTAADEVNAGPSASGATMRETATADAAASVTKSKGHTNIQIIRSRKEKEKEKVALEVAPLPVNVSAEAKAESQNKETRRAVVAAVQPPAAEIGLVKSVSLVGAVPVVKSIEKSIVASAPVVPIAPVAPVVPVVPVAPVETVAVNTVTVDKNPTVLVSKPVYHRWHFRKRFRGSPRKVYYSATATDDSQSSPSDIVGGLYANAVGDSGGTVAVGKTVYTSGSLFDDIFNIPISTLSAVNQLLKNNVG